VAALVRASRERDETLFYSRPVILSPHLVKKAASFAVWVCFADAL